MAAWQVMGSELPGPQGCNAQPERDVYLRTLANLTNPSEVRSILQLARKELQTRTLSEEMLIFAHRILPWRYRKLSVLRAHSASDLLFASLDDAANTSYSEFHMSSGKTQHPADLEGHFWSWTTRWF